MSKKVIEMSPDMFQKMVLEVKELKLQIKKLRNANAFLNDEIVKYDKKFTIPKEHIG